MRVHAISKLDERPLQLVHKYGWRNTWEKSCQDSHIGLSNCIYILHNKEPNQASLVVQNDALDLLELDANTTYNVTLRGPVYWL